MNRHLRNRTLPLAAAGIAMLVGTVARADTKPQSELTRVGATAIVYRGPQLDMALSYRFAKYNPTGDWLLLDTSMTAVSEPVEVRRDAIAVRTPTGDIVPLASQQAFADDYAHLAGRIALADVTREPLGYLLPRRPRRLDFFAQYRPGLVFPLTWLDQWHNTYGRLFFRLPDGVQKGRYDLLINLPESKVVIPFTI